MPPQNMQLWQVDYFELKAIKNQHDSEEALTSPFIA